MSDRSNLLDIDVVTLANHDRNLALPRHETALAAGMDLRACLAEEDRASGLALPSLGRLLVPTGLALGIPAGWEGQVRPRSGLAARHGITVLNSPGTVDADYRGEVKVLLVNLGPETFVIEHGARIAQLVVAAHASCEVRLTDALGETDRGAGGFGSTGRG